MQPALSRERQAPTIGEDGRTASASVLQIFSLRCWARARPYAEGIIDLHAAVDVLQAAAERDGLINTIGQDAVQELIAAEFKVHR